MTKDWGYAALVEIGGKRILFDTGDDPRILAKNAKAKGVDLTAFSTGCHNRAIEKRPTVLVLRRAQRAKKVPWVR